ncbi:MAG TPA: hypothetical protein PLB35_10420 [Myxococcota bacterium]|nr:hypothetical protein [Myxococcota bacterium]HOH77655.1 hypothetical protein [Myxococcota bacterium]
MKFDLAVIVLATALLVPGCSDPGPKGASGAVDTAGRPVAETPAWSLRYFMQTGFHAESNLTMVIRRADRTVEIVDSATMNLLADGEMSFVRSRTHKGAAEGVSVESFSATRKDGSWFTAGSSGQWVRWDDAITQPSAMVDSFIAGEDSLLRIAHDCGRQGKPDEEGRVPLTLLADRCRFETSVMPGSTKTFGGRVNSLSGYLVMSGNAPAGAAIRIEFVSTHGGGETPVSLNYELRVSPGGIPGQIAAPKHFVESRRPRPVKMVESVLSGIVKDWGPGAPEVLRKRPPGSGR